MQRLFGILYLDDKRTDIDKKGNHLKKFKSFYNSTELIIKTKKTDMHRTYCIINYPLTSQKNNDMSINNYIKQDYLDNELFKLMGTCNWTMRLQNLKEEQTKSYLIDNTNNTRIDYNTSDIISIDPDNCIDIDDAISYYDNNTNYIELGIHIADPSSYINLDTELGRELINRCESKCNLKYASLASVGAFSVSIWIETICRFTPRISSLPSSEARSVDG